MEKKVYELKYFLQNKLKVDLGFIVSVFTQSPSSVLVLDSDFYVCTCNESVYTMFGCESEAEFSDNFSELFPRRQPDGEYSKTKIKTFFDTVYNTGKELFPITCCTMAGKLINTEFTFLKLDSYDENGKAYIMCFVLDVSTATKEREREKMFAKRFKALIDATPLCLNLWNSKFENLMCNTKAVTLFDLATEQQYLDEFFKLSPPIQPDGRNSADVAHGYIKEAFEKGYAKFKWMHCKLNGDEIPAEITLVKVLGVGEDGEDMVAGFTRDLRPQLLGYSKIHAVEEYFFNKISDKTLINIMSKLSEEWFFVVDLSSSSIQYFGNGSKIFDSDNDNTMFPEHLTNSGIIYKDDIPEFLRIAENMKMGVVTSSDIRLVALDGEVKYHKFIYQIISNEEGAPMVAIGKATDINEQKNIELRSKTDLLTNCYNKITAETAISDALYENDNENHALFIIDIDNFKAINDNLGHHFGDLVLSEIASELKPCFRNDDIIGRIGGDEFIAFARNISDITTLKAKAKKIGIAFNKTYQGEQGSYNVSASVGISRYPADGKNYEDLYKAADKALYQSKLAGKNRATFYDIKFLDGTMKNRTTLENASRVASVYLDTELISIVFNLLYEAKNITSSLNLALKLLGEKFGADRSYIFESRDNGKTYSNTLEWCKGGIKPEIDNLQNLSEEVLRPFFVFGEKSSIVYSNDLSIFEDARTFELMNNQDIKSFLHAQVKEKKFVKLFLGLDDCTKARIWNEKEINTLQYLAKTMSTFLLLNEERNKVKLLSNDTN